MSISLITEKNPNVNHTAAWVIAFKSFMLIAVCHIDISGSLILKRPAIPRVLANHAEDYLWNLSSVDMASILIA